MQLVRKQLRRKHKAVRRLCKSVPLVYSKIGGLQLSCELVDMSVER